MNGPWFQNCLKFCSLLVSEILNLERANMIWSIYMSSLKSFFLAAKYYLRSSKNIYLWESLTCLTCLQRCKSLRYNSWRKKCMTVVLYTNRLSQIPCPIMRFISADLTMIFELSVVELMYIFWQLMNNPSKLFESFCQQHFFVNACVLVCRYWQAAGRRERRSNQCWTDPASWQTHKRLPASWSLYKTLFVDPKPKIYAWLFSATALRIQICSDEQKAHWELTFLADTEWTKNL